MSVIQRPRKYQVKLELAVAEFLGFLQRSDRLLDVARVIQAGSKHESDVRHVLLLWIHLQRRCKNLGCAGVVLLLAKPGAEVIQR